METQQFRRLRSVGGISMNVELRFLGELFVENGVILICTLDFGEHCEGLNDKV